jgi:hypothetical protein
MTAKDRRFMFEARDTYLKNGKLSPEQKDKWKSVFARYPKNSLRELFGHPAALPAAFSLLPGGLKRRTSKDVNEMKPSEREVGRRGPFVDMLLKAGVSRRFLEPRHDVHDDRRILVPRKRAFAAASAVGRRT